MMNPKVHEVKMRSFIFVTSEGYAFQPASKSVDPDAENMQVLGFAQGEDAQTAFNELTSENSWLVEISFHELCCLELANPDFESQREYSSLKQSRS